MITPKNTRVFYTPDIWRYTWSCIIRLTLCQRIIFFLPRFLFSFPFFFNHFLFSSLLSLPSPLLSSPLLSSPLLSSPLLSSPLLSSPLSFPPLSLCLLFFFFFFTSKILGGSIKPLKPPLVMGLCDEYQHIYIPPSNVSASPPTQNMIKSYLLLINQSSYMVTIATTSMIKHNQARLFSCIYRPMIKSYCFQPIHCNIQINKKVPLRSDPITMM